MNLLLGRGAHGKKTTTIEGGFKSASKMLKIFLKRDLMISRKGIADVLAYSDALENGQKLSL